MSTNNVRLAEITPNNIEAVLAMHVHPRQEKQISSNAIALARAAFEPYSWCRAIYVADQPVGMMVATLDTDQAKYELTHFMLDVTAQGHGYGRASLNVFIEHVRTLPNVTELLLSYLPDSDSPAPFYARTGFMETWQWENGKKVMHLPLSPAPLKRVHHNKLIRDQIPEMLAKEKKHYSIQELDDKIFKEKLPVQLVEEAAEILAALRSGRLNELIQELADLHELFDSLLAAMGISETAVKIKQAQRRETLGGFDKQLWLEWVEPQPATTDKDDSPE